MLPEERRTQLDGILSKMEQNGESRDTIDFVVNDFKNKYSVQPPERSFTEKTGDVLDMIFGGKKVGEAIGTQIAKMTVPKEQRQYIESGPKPLEIAGSALQSASLFIPAGAGAKTITTGLRSLGLKKGVSALGKVSSGVLTGEVFDIASNLQQGKTGKDALTPSFGALIGGSIPLAGVAKNVSVRFGERQAPRVINSLIKPLAKDFSYGKNPGRAVAEEGIVANNFDDLIDGIRTSRQRIGQEIGKLGDTLSERPLLNIQDALNPIDEAIKTAVSQNNQTLLSRLNNVKRALTEVLEPTLDDTGNIAIKSLGSKNLDNLTFNEARKFLGEVGDLTSFTGNPTDDKLVNSALKQVYGKVKQKTINTATEINPQLAKKFQKLTEKYADLTSAEVATKYRDKIVERSALIGLSPQTAGIGAGLITAVATGGATIPSILTGVSAGLIDKLAQTPAFKTRLAYILSKKTQGEVNFLLRKIPALKSFFDTKNGVTLGDVVLNKTKNLSEDLSKIPNKQGGFASISSKSDDITLSIQKAKASGQSFDDWVKGQTSKAFHGTDVANIIEKEGFKKMPIKTGVSAFGEGSYLTSSRANAKGYGGVVDAYLPKNIKLKKVFDSDAYKVDTKKLIKDGFDGVELETGQGKNITIFDPSKIKTRSQLKAEWDKIKPNSQAGNILKSPLGIMAGVTATGAGIAQGIKSLAQPEIGLNVPTEQPKTQKPQQVKYKDVPINVNQDDIEELKAVLFGEISNRSLDKKELEARVILSTVLNRIKEHKDYKKAIKSIKDIVTEKNQYQAYGSEQYKKYKTGLDTLGQKKKQEINALVEKLLDELKQGKFKDITNGALYYIHNDNGTITYDDKKPLFKK
jgi:hypothetical protein